MGKYDEEMGAGVLRRRRRTALNKGAWVEGRYQKCAGLEQARGLNNVIGSEGVGLVGAQDEVGNETTSRAGSCRQPFKYKGLVKRKREAEHWRCRLAERATA